MARTMYFVYDSTGRQKFTTASESKANSLKGPGDTVTAHEIEPYTKAPVSDVPEVPPVLIEPEPEVIVIPEPETWIPKPPPLSAIELKRIRESRNKELREKVHEIKNQAERESGSNQAESISS